MKATKDRPRSPITINLRTLRNLRAIWAILFFAPLVKNLLFSVSDKKTCVASEKYVLSRRRRENKSIFGFGCVSLISKDFSPVMFQ